MVDIENNDNEGGGQTPPTNTKPVLSPLLIYDITKTNGKPKVINIRQVVEESSRKCAALQSQAMESSNRSIDTFSDDNPLKCRTCMRGFVKNLELCLIYPVTMFLAIYHLIAVINFDSYCVDCKPKIVVFDMFNVTLNGHRYYASGVTHWSLCSAVIVSTLMCAILFFLWREWWVTLINGSVMLALAVICLVIPFYFLCLYFLIVSIVLFIIAALRFSIAAAEHRLNEERERQALIQIEERRQQEFYEIHRHSTEVIACAGSDYFPDRCGPSRALYAGRERIQTEYNGEYSASV